MASVTSTSPSGAFFRIGITNVIVRVTDFARLSSTCNFNVTVFPGLLAFARVYDPEVVEDESERFTVPAALVNDEWDLQFETTARLLGTTSTNITRTLGSITFEGTNGTYLRAFVYPSTIEVELSDGELRQEVTYTYDPKPVGQRTSYKFRYLYVGANNENRRLRVFVNNALVDDKLVPRFGPFVPDRGDGSFVAGMFGDPSTGPFNGLLHSISMIQLSACFKEPCGLGSACTLDVLNVSKRTCACRTGWFEGDDGTCQPTDTSVYTC